LPIRSGLFLALSVAHSLTPGLTSGALLINEFLPDPAGPDAGQEFVELINTGGQTHCLDGVCLQFGNGVESAQWETRWTGAVGDSLRPGERFLIVDRNWLGPAQGQAEVWLGLQNGPDALRLQRDDLTLDRVGYGALTDTAMVEGAAVPVVAGLALARRPDGRDTQDNSRDFVPTEPTPGEPNFRPYDLRLLDLQLDPPSADRPDVPVRVTAELVNIGTEFLPARPLQLWVNQEPGPTAMQEGWAPDDVRTVSLIFQATHAGPHDLALRHGDPGQTDFLTLPLGGLQVGPGPVILNEVQGAPVHHEGEWCEIRVTGSEPVSLGTFALRDEEGEWVALPDTVLAPGALMTVCQSPADFTHWLADLAAHGYSGDCPDVTAGEAPPTVAGSWPGLNNTAPDSRDFADRLYLRDGTGTVIDHVTLEADRSGASWERRVPAPEPGSGPNWRPTTSPASGTPGCANSVTRLAVATAGLTAAPPVLDPDSGSGNLHLSFTVPETAQAWRLKLFDLWGHPVRDLGGDARGSGPRDVVWDGRDDRGAVQADGPCVAVLEILDATGQGLSRNRCLIVVRRGSR